jgi:membrane fusion protein, copper/silver efflux system
MNKYVLRTSLVWLIVFAVVGGILLYRSGTIGPRFTRHSANATPASGQVQPEAAGPAPTAATSTSMTPEHATPQDSTVAPFAPVQLTPERMQSIGVKTGTVEYKQVSDDIRATGNVDVDERLVSYVQVRFPGYIRKV